MRCPSCLILILTLALAACGADTATPESPDAAQEALAEAGAESVAGTYRLLAINEKPLPSRIGAVDECEVQLSEGRLTLDADATYELDVLARAVCDEEEDEEAQLMDRATGKGPFTVQGSELRFSPAPVETEDEEDNDASAEQQAEDAMDEADAMPELYDAKQFAGMGMIRDTLLTIRLADDATTLSFVKE